MSAIILDTETTDTESPQVIELAYIQMQAPVSRDSDILVRRRFRPSKPISLGAMATHHIIPADLVDEPEWPGRWDLPEGVQYLVGHNIDFDWHAIGSPNVKRICTLALARSVWPEIDSHRLSALMYYLYPHRMARELVREARPFWS